ncbi:MAG: hypothetical protein KJN75_01070 [Muriicola sp.]|nr:hypothetical protein [Muriicola sp.]
MKEEGLVSCQSFFCRKEVQCEEVLSLLHPGEKLNITLEGLSAIGQNPTK